MKNNKVLYICSAGRSGSTLVDLLLGSHSQCTSLGEIEHLPKNLTLNTLCSCGVPARECVFWNMVAGRIKTTWGKDILQSPYSFPVGLFKASRVIDFSHQTPSYLRKRRRIHAVKLLEYWFGIEPKWLAWLTSEFEEGVSNTVNLFEVVREVSGKPVVVDSSKDYRKGIALYRRDPENVRLLVLTRDGRGVFNSERKSGVGREACVPPWVRYYSRAISLIEKNVPQEHQFHLRYEDLAGNTTDTLSALCEFAGISFESSMLDFRQTVHHILNGNAMRLGTGSEVRLDERWRTELSADDLAYFERVGGGAMNRRLGYVD
jgi:hypothetical protein